MGGNIEFLLIIEKNTKIEEFEKFKEKYFLVLFVHFYRLDGLADNDEAIWDQVLNYEQWIECMLRLIGTFRYKTW